MRKPAPLLYEINSRCWLRELSEHAGRQLTLADIPPLEFSHWVASGVTHLWLMGIWATSPASIAFSQKDSTLRRKYSRLLPGFSGRDITGSPYAIAGYEPSAVFGGDAALCVFRRKLNQHGIKLLLDFIPNHTGLDHPRVVDDPDCYISHRNARAGTFRAQTCLGRRWIAHGKDPYFPPWVDTAQLDLRNPHTRTALIADLLQIADRCDGVRCDMAMLATRDIFERQWGSDSRASWEFWPEAIAAVKARHPEFLFLGEVYWDLEARLLELGFDFVYDKRVYDLLVDRKPDELQALLLSRSPDFLHRTCHFLENHDEPRVAAVLSLPEHRAAAALLLTLPGMRLLHEGQLAGAKLRASVHLDRRPPEPVDPEIAALYSSLLSTLPNFNLGQSTLLRPEPAWSDNPSHVNLIVIQGEVSSGGSFDLVAVNLAPHASQCRVQPTVPERPFWSMCGLLSAESSTRSGPELLHPGLYLDLPAHGTQAFRFAPRFLPSSL